MVQPSERVRDLIATAVKHKRKQENRDITFKEIAEHLDITEARLSSYNTGSRIPPEPIAEKMARYFYAAEKDRKQFVVELGKSKEESRQQSRASRDGILDRLASGERLRVSAFKSEPFSGTKEAFFNQLLDRFFSLSGLNTVVIEPPSLYIDRALWDNILDLWLGCFARVDRSVLSHFWTTPIRVSLGAVILSKHERDKEWVKKVLSQVTRRVQRIRPIVVKGEAGSIYCKEALHFEDTEIISLNRFDPVQLAERLRASSTESEIHVVVVDEYTSFQVLRELRGEGVPVIELSSRESIRKPGARRELPQYFLGFACSRRQRELQQMIDESFFLFLSTELETTANAMALLYGEVMKEIQSVAEYYFEPGKPLSEQEETALRFQYARSWALYSLALDREAIETYPRSGMPWRPILERARQIVQEELAEDEGTIKNQINLCSHYDENSPLSHDRFRTLCELFDLPVPKLTYAQEQYVFEDRDMVLRTIQDVLQGKPVPPLEPRIDTIWPLTQHAASTVSGFIAETSKMYKQHLGENNNASSEINRFFQSEDGPSERYHKFSEEFLGVILASHGKHEPDYIGCACLRTYKGLEAKERELEICYLLVREAFRNLKIARYLLYTAHKIAKEQNYTALVFEALPEYFEGVLYLEKRHFERTVRKADHGRIVLEYPTVKAFRSPMPNKEASNSK